MVKEDAYVTIRIPKQIANEIDRIINSGSLGYRSRAELVTEATRLRIELIDLNDRVRNNVHK
jgi:metal-responsive CopG/Arc/MetJ family transcriptional regulator